ncbi:hypothetical protein [Algoriphagus sp.]|uniref:hypothetical protein n=1 Tax=Algoriphagus sp. TaxID=1872435 RepID=UPI00391BDC5D
MKKFYITALALVLSVSAFAQTQRSLEDINQSNSWLKIGALIGAPTGAVADYSTFVAGLDLSAQFLRTNSFGVGIATGYSKYFKKTEAQSFQGMNDGFGAIPLGLLLRFYPAQEGLFVGTDLGYTFISGVTSQNKGGAYIRPMLGYHNYDWNVFAYYNHIFRPETTIDVQSIGLGITRNLRFN